MILFRTIQCEGIFTEAPQAMLSVQHHNLFLTVLNLVHFYLSFNRFHEQAVALLVTNDPVKTSWTLGVFLESKLPTTVLFLLSFRICPDYLTKSLALLLNFPCPLSVFSLLSFVPAGSLTLRKPAPQQQQPLVQLQVTTKVQPRSPPAAHIPCP